MAKKQKQTQTQDVPKIDDTTFRALIERNILAVRAQLEEDPNKILVSVQLQEDQIDHLNRGLTGRSRRLIPLPVFVELVTALTKKTKKKK